MTHTPGPWRVHDWSEGVSVMAERKVNGATRVSMVASEVFGSPIDVGVYGDPLPNANLIAAAPDLLEASKATLAVLDDQLGDTDLPNDDGSDEFAAFRKLAAAIAKAEGRG